MSNLNFFWKDHEAEVTAEITPLDSLLKNAFTSFEDSMKTNTDRQRTLLNELGQLENAYEAALKKTFKPQLIAAYKEVQLVGAKLSKVTEGDVDGDGLVEEIEDSVRDKLYELVSWTQRSGGAEIELESNGDFEFWEPSNC